MHKLQEKPSALKREHPALQNMKKKFPVFLGHFWLRDPDQQLKLIRIRIHNPDWGLFTHEQVWMFYLTFIKNLIRD